jgi:hypothetical protein
VTSDFSVRPNLASIICGVPLELVFYIEMKSAVGKLSAKKTTIIFEPHGMAHGCHRIFRCWLSAVEIVIIDMKFQLYLIQQGKKKKVMSMSLSLPFLCL